jgi:hypothetical protein
MDVDSASVPVVEFENVILKKFTYRDFVQVHFLLISSFTDLDFCFCFLIDILPSSQFLGDLLLGLYWKNLRKFSSRLINILLNLQFF